jgi:hypothetical protein
MGRLSHHHVPPSATRGPEAVKCSCVLSLIPSRILLSVTAAIFELCCFAVFITLPPTHTHPEFPLLMFVSPIIPTCMLPTSIHIVYVPCLSSQFLPSPFDVRLRQHADDIDVTHVPYIYCPSRLLRLPTLNTFNLTPHPEFSRIILSSFEGHSQPGKVSCIDCRTHSRRPWFLRKNLKNHPDCASHRKTAGEAWVKRETKEILDRLREQERLRFQAVVANTRRLHARVQAFHLLRYTVNQYQ